MQHGTTERIGYVDIETPIYLADEMDRILDGYDDQLSDITNDVSGLEGSLSDKQDTIPLGTSSQYYRGDKTWQTMPTESPSDWNATSGTTQILNKPTLFSGSYTDLTNKPTIPSAQIQSDWAQANNVALDYIKNKPTLFSGAYADLTGKPVLATVATSGSYADLTNKPSIPSAQVNSDWNANTGVAQILNKPLLATVAISLLFQRLKYSRTGIKQVLAP